MADNIPQGHLYPKDNGKTNKKKYYNPRHTSNFGFPVSDFVNNNPSNQTHLTKPLTNTYSDIAHSNLLWVAMETTVTAHNTIWERDMGNRNVATRSLNSLWHTGRAKRKEIVPLQDIEECDKECSDCMWLWKESWLPAAFCASSRSVVSSRQNVWQQWRLVECCYFYF